MPIRPELRALYRGPKWEAARKKVFARAGGRCERCRALRGSRYISVRTGRMVIVQLSAAHLDHEDLARFYDEDNLRCLCRSCHLRMDTKIHVIHARDTRKSRKDSARPLLEAAA